MCVLCVLVVCVGKLFFMPPATCGNKNSPYFLKDFVPSAILYYLIFIIIFHYQQFKYVLEYTWHSAQGRALYTFVLYQSLVLLTIEKKSS